MEHKEGRDYFSSLPRDVVETILSSMSPRDLCRLSTLSTAFRTATESDFLWEKLMPYDFLKMSLSADILVSWYSGSMKDLFFLISDHLFPVFLDKELDLDLDKSTGKLICRVTAANLCLELTFRNYISCLRWKSSDHLNSRWKQIPDDIVKCGRGFAFRSQNIYTKFLSQNTTYEAYCVFEITEETYHKPFQFLVEVLITRSIPGKLEILESQVCGLVSQRHDGLLEVKIGEFHVGEGDGKNGAVAVKLRELNEYDDRRCFLVFGIELRPKMY